MENDENIITMDFKQFNWNMTQLQNNNNESVKVIISANSYRAPNIIKTGVVSITVRIYKDNCPWTHLWTKLIDDKINLSV